MAGSRVGSRGSLFVGVFGSVRSTAWLTEPWLMARPSRPARVIAPEEVSPRRAPKVEV